MLLINIIQSTATILVGVRSAAGAHSGHAVWTSGARLNRQHCRSTGSTRAQREGIPAYCLQARCHNPKQHFQVQHTSIQFKKVVLHFYAYGFN
jgi:hypothetical protein